MKTLQNKPGLPFATGMTNMFPKHIAIIMDGNRRWAKAQGKNVLAGHQYVADVVIEQLIDQAIARGISYITFWAWSTENWKRSQTEVVGIMRLFRALLKKNIERLHQKGVRVNYIGDLSKFPVDIQKEFTASIKKTEANKKITVTFALNYGGRDEIIRSIYKLNENFKFQISNFKLTPEDISSVLDTTGIPDPEMIIRTGGEKRLSGFLLWQSEYSELYFTDVLMPDFTPEELDKALLDFSQRQRRFGK